MIVAKSLRAIKIECNNLAVQWFLNWLDHSDSACSAWHVRTLQMFTFHRQFFSLFKPCFASLLKVSWKKSWTQKGCEMRRYQNQLASIVFSDSYHENIWIAVIVFIEYVKLPKLSLDTIISFVKLKKDTSWKPKNNQMSYELW